MGRKTKGVKKLPSEKLNEKVIREFDETVSASEARIEDLAKKLVADGIAKDMTEAQGLVLANPANAKLKSEYEAKFKI